MKLYKPEVFQGALSKKHYFEGWYFKHVSKDMEHVYALIPGISLSRDDKHAFIQKINGITGETAYFQYPLQDFWASRKELSIRVGDSTFSKNGIDINIDQNGTKITGKVDYSKLTHYPKKLFSPGIMGWFSFVPMMECKHGIVSVQHQLNGRLHIGDKTVDFDGGNGYIEKDWGTSFPESWIWVHCNNFEKSDASLTFSVAKIPWLGSFFMGLICLLYYQGKYYLFATYNRSEVKKLEYGNNRLLVELTGKNHKLEIQVVQNRSGDLKAPSRGEMSRIIKESIDSNVEIILSDQEGKILYQDHGTRAGMEIIEKVLKYY
ncbi:MAG: tocopherol cyclase family protein [Bacteroidales bacterium]|nr:tocopherol cyclase family protein [Bacteroidales bacterium]MCF8344319.1 tocopherol cyclase family protein [Bacteroidales bacterium]MCF8352471.1 tocopherol cyclase family protein [Bacteroidales bacterium]MCF8377291.1 tocopherol cyclase family protein [Bacteroidales bacterium]MCF8401405.1 tocopherol cyclase family protein [Bacteroidales bacterium]